MGKYCRICQHPVLPVVTCSVVECEDSGKLHYHCVKGHLCTLAGCWPKADE